MSIKEEEVKRILDEYVSNGLLRKDKKGYIYPDWLLPYCKDKKLMGGISKAIDLTQQKMIKEFKEMIDERIDYLKNIRNETDGFIMDDKERERNIQINTRIEELQELKSQVEKT